MAEANVHPLAIGLATAVAAALAMMWLHGCDSSDASTSGASRPRQFTEKEFANYAKGRTKAQIREEFGSPDTVMESDDMWAYDDHNRQLVVTDPTAGIRVIPRITFAGTEGPTDPELSVAY